MLTLAEQGGRGGPANADNTNKNASKWAKIKFLLNSYWNIHILVKYCIFVTMIGNQGEGPVVYNDKTDGAKVGLG